ncbi:hypothetical protein [Candidatus Skiveiella danica]|uniref:hypothetical protein n=1 Tax=Candidatus Skiveiella danica TaxID=3386177 RepID=UPI001DDA23D0|nr:hypothetical protein [Betaproteobacteria bacterium]
MNDVISVDISPMANRSVGIGKSVSGLMKELPATALSERILVRPISARRWGSLAQHWLADTELLRMHAPLAAESWLKKLGLIERLTKAPCFMQPIFICR